MEYRKLLSKEMQLSLKNANYNKPTPIQEQTLLPILQKKDLIGIAQTGTGKTAAFAIPVIEQIYTNNNKVQALILCPTRELAIQTTEVFRKLASFKKMRVVSVYGGQSATVQIKALRAGAQVVVGTPGRVKDLIERNVLKLKNVRIAILDEADEMLDFGFLPDIKNIMARITAQHQTLLFSATMSKDVAKVAEQFQVDPVRVEVGRTDEPIDTVRQTFIHTEEQLKTGAVTYIMKESKPKLTLVFCNTRSRVKRLCATLLKQGIDSECLHGDLSQAQRDKIMSSFRNGKSSVLVATDVAARGIDVDNIDIVINFDVPDKSEYYVHRIGRTGRAGKSGTAFTLVSPRDKDKMAEITKRYKIKTA